MRTIIRNFTSTLKRFKTASLLNVVGLSVAFAAFIIIMMQVNYERNFDRCHPTASKVFRVSVPSESVFSIIFPRPFVEAVIQSSPHIVAGTIINPYLSAIYMTVQDAGERKGFRETFVTCHPDIIRVFGFSIVEGDFDCLKDPDKVILPKSLARTLFGNASAIGKTLHAEEPIWSKNRQDFTVGAVYNDFPGNTQLKNVIYTAMDRDFAMDNWGASNYLCYLLLDSPDAAQAVEDNFNRNFDYTKLSWGNRADSIYLTPLTDIYYLNESQDGVVVRSGNKEAVNLLALIAILVIVVAGINFTNFSTALAPLRIKSINTQKVLGSSSGTLRRALLTEALGISLLSYLVSLALVWVLIRTTTLSFLEVDLYLNNNLTPILVAGIVALAVGLLAGLYPAYYMTSFSPAVVLKGSFGVSPAGRRLRTFLIGFQFIVSIVLIIVSLFIQLQSSYMRNYSQGFDKDQIAIVELSGDLYKKHRDEYSNRLKTFSGIEDVAFSMQKMGSRDGYSTSGGTYKGQEFQYYSFPVSWNFFQVMGIPITEGRSPTSANGEGGQPSVIINKEMSQKYGMQVGDELYPGIVISGLTDDVKFTSLRQGSDNAVFSTGTSYFSKNISYVRLKAGSDYVAAVDHIRKTIADIDPSYPFQIEFYDAVFDKLYKKEENLRKMIQLFSVLSIIISMVGVFGLVIFETQYRRKEISVRKVHGATTGHVLLLFNRIYLCIVVACFAVSVPIAYYCVTRWQQNFAYKTPLYWWVFALAFVIVTVITVATVSFQNRKAANENPVNALKNE